MQRNPHSYQIATGYRTFYSLSLIYQPITKKRLFFFEKLSKFACVIHKNRGGSTRPDERDFSYLSPAVTNIFHRCFHLYAVMGSKIIVCIYGIGYTFIQLFKAVIFAVKQPPILDRVIHPFSQSIM